jgi:hypothetical protein
MAMEAPVPITKILIETRRCVEARGHALSPFRHGPAGASAVCRRCGGGVAVSADGRALMTGALDRPCQAHPEEAR